MIDFSFQSLFMDILCLTYSIRYGSTKKVSLEPISMSFIRVSTEDQNASREREILEAFTHDNKGSVLVHREC